MKLLNQFLTAHCSVNFAFNCCFTKQKFSGDFNVQSFLRKNQTKGNKICLGMKFIAAVIKKFSRKFEWLSLILILVKNKLFHKCQDLVIYKWIFKALHFLKQSQTFTYRGSHGYEFLENIYMFNNEKIMLFNRVPLTILENKKCPNWRSKGFKKIKACQTSQIRSSESPKK